MPEEYNQKTQVDPKKEPIEKGLIQAEEAQEARRGEALDRQLTGETISSKIPGLHTLKGDISSYIKERDLSLAEIASQAPRGRRSEQETAKTGKNFFIIIGLVLAAVVSIGTYYLFFKKEMPSEIATGDYPRPFVLSDKTEVIRLKSEKQKEIVGLIQKATEALIPLNTILSAPFFIETPEQTGFIDSRKFLEILKITPPANFLQSLEKDFTFGVYYFKKNNPFLVFKVRSFDLAFSGALNWEKDMADDLKDVLLISSPANQKFQDAIIKNIDSRVLYNNENNPVLIYAFFNRQYLVVSVDIDTFNEIIRRLSIPR